MNIKAFILFLFFTGMVYAQTTQWTVSWKTNTEPDVNNYLVFRNTTPGATNEIASVAHNASVNPTEYIDNNLTKGVSYYYRLKATDLSSNQSDFSVEVSAAIPNIIQTTFSFENLDADTVAFVDLFSDPDNTDNEMAITASIQTNCVVSVVNESIRIAPSPTNFVGQASFVLNVADPIGFFDQQTVTVNYDSAAPAAPVIINITR